ncbi:MAG: sulfurtransferase TusA family protein [Planctomycetes bacterium]|nr:sulfurtransferase TusA family protein [Planctomycetota bacterium]
MTQPADHPHAHAVHDSGATLCGELALDLRARLRAMEPGQVLRVIARDPAAPQDLPAWCEVTGHTLIHRDHPDYWIRRRND